MSNQKALLLLDVDGVLNPFGASRNWLDKSNFRRRNTTVANGFTFPVWINRDHGKLLLDLCVDNNLELTWCTTWEDEANDFIGPRLGLPQLPVIKFVWEPYTWKYDAVLEYAADRPLAWLDDDFDRFDRNDFMDARAGVPTLLQQCVSETGLTTDDLDAIDKWAKEL